MNKQSLITTRPVWLIDIDGTLILHDYKEWQGLHATTIKCPYLGDYVNVTINENNIRMLKEKAMQGFFIIAWSQGNGLWAEAVIKALHLESYCDIICGKPAGCIDDLDPATWMPKNTNLPVDLKWKNGHL